MSETNLYEVDVLWKFESHCIPASQSQQPND